MDKIFEGFEFGVLQECRTIKAKMDQHGISWPEFVAWIDDKAKRIKPSPKQQRLAIVRECPDCNAPLRLYSVNNSRCAMVGGDWKSQWRCSHCEWEEFSGARIEDEAKLYTKIM